jgi:hypothetical protein
MSEAAGLALTRHPLPSRTPITACIIMVTTRLGSAGPLLALRRAQLPRVRWRGSRREERTGHSALLLVGAALPIDLGGVHPDLGVHALRRWHRGQPAEL